MGAKVELREGAFPLALWVKNIAIRLNLESRLFTVGLTTSIKL